MERPRRRELAELVPDHVLGHRHGNVLMAVVDAERQADELRQDRRAPAPHLDDLVAARHTHFIRLLEDIAVDERTLPNCACHTCSPRAAKAYFFFALRLRMMYLSVDLFLRVLAPFVGLPHGVAQCLPPLVRPPLGWSIGFMAIGRTGGRFPFQRVRPALPVTVLEWSGLETAPIVAMHSARTRRVSPELSFRIAQPESRPTSCTKAPAERASWPPRPAFSSTLCTMVPIGMPARGIALPGFTSTFWPETTW